MNRMRNGEKELRKKSRTKTLYRIQFSEGEDCTEKCTGCLVCTMICSLYHYKQCNPSLSGIKIIMKESEWIHHSSLKVFDHKVCNQCGFCIQLCPIDAIERHQKTGVVVIDDGKCTRCLQCVRGCPFDAIWHNTEIDKIMKCDLCGESPTGPKCVEWCPKKVLVRTEQIKLI